MTRTGVWRCPRCGIVRTTLVAVRPGVVLIDVEVRRAICPAEGADMEPVTAEEIALLGPCSAAGHEVEAWRGRCDCGTVRT